MATLAGGYLADLLRRDGLAADDQRDVFEGHIVAETTLGYLERRAPLPDLLEMIENLLERTTPPMHLTRGAILSLLQRTTSRTAMLQNPHEYATRLVAILKEKLADQLVTGIHYERSGEWYDMGLIEEEVLSTKELLAAPHALYDRIGCDSDVERRFVEDLEKRQDVVLYFKLPGWFTVTTPIGEYNPDWAIVMKETDGHEALDGKRLYLVRETKSTEEQDKLRPDERRKIACGKVHFIGALGVDYKVVTSASDLP